MKKTNSLIVTIFTKTVLLLLTALIICFCIWFCWTVYDEGLCESARLSKKFNSKVESLSSSGIKSVRLRDLTDFEWDVVCVYGDGDKGESINLKDHNLVDQIGYKPNFLFRSTYFIPYDFNGLVFSNSKTKRITVLHRIWHWSYFEFDDQRMNFATGCYKVNQELIITK
jgi:hypothetical protein